MVQIALVQNSNTANIAIIYNGNYVLNLPDGTQVTPVQAPYVGNNWSLCDINFDPNQPTYLFAVQAGANVGNAYVANDVCTIAGGTSSGNVAQVRVSSIGPNGVVASLLITNSGFYTASPNTDNFPTGGHGTGLELSCDFEPVPVSSETYTYNVSNNTVTQTNVYQTPVIDNTVSIELQRQASIKGDPNVQTMLTKLQTASSAQIDNWLQTNVTNLAQALVILGAIVKFLANKYPLGIK